MSTIVYNSISNNSQLITADHRLNKVLETGISIMSKFKSILNKTAQITIAVVDCANTATLKTIGVITNEAGNAVGASLDTLSDLSARKLGGDKSPKGSFGYHYKVRHDNDFKLQKVLDGRMSPEHYVNEQLGDLLPTDLMDKINDIINPKTTSNA